jgi:alkylation response protein AidB-like acyl-CoA dehydrogenase
MDRAELQNSARRAFGEGGLVPDADTSWRQLTEMGWFMMTVPEAQGGLGLGWEAVTAIHSELGRALIPGAAISHMLVVEALSFSGHTDLLEQAMAGTKMTVDHFACDADQASHILAGGDAGIYLVEAGIATLTPRPTWDETRRLFEMADGTTGFPIAQGETAKQLSERLQKLLLLMLSADSIGGAEAALSMTVEYLKTRRQFDRPLAMFQALKHRVADLKIALNGAEALLWSRANDAVTLAAMGALKAHCTTVYARIAEEAIQLHGGIGLTQEHPCHLFLKRAYLNCTLGGDADFHEERAGRALMERFS